MRMRREEMVNIVNDVRNRMKSDVRKQLNDFFRKSGVSVDSFSNTINVPREEIRSILGGNVNISLDTFVKIMVGTGNALEIKPIVSNLPRNTMPRGNGRMPFPPFGPHPSLNRGKMPRMPWEQIEEEVERPRPWQNPVEEMHDEVEPRLDLHSKTREQLVQDVIDMGLENEIDLRRATRSALINFLSSQEEELVREFDSQEPMPMDIYDGETVNDANVDEDEVSNVVERIASLMRNNPQFKENIMNVMRG